MTTKSNQQTVRPETLDPVSDQPGVPTRDGAASARVTPFPPRMLESERVGEGERHQTIAEGQGDSGRSGFMKRPNMKVAIAVLIAATVGVVAWVVRQPAAPAPATAVAAATLELAAVDVDTVQARVLSRSLPLSGTLAPIVQATVRSKVGGEVEAVTFREGQDVREGDVMARIDTRNLQAQYDRELASVEKARADLDLAQLNRDKNRTLLEQRYISQNTYEQTESAHAGSVASLKLAEAQARLAKIGLEDAVVRAPFTGTIAKRLVQPGEKVSPDSNIIALVDLRQMVLEAALPAAEIPSVQPGQKVRFKVGGFGEREFEGEVQRINPVTTDGSRAITIYVSVPNPDRALKGGMFAKGELTLDATEPVLAVPQRAIREDAGARYVYTLRDGKLGRADVTLGRQLAGSSYVEVRDGLAAGDRVVVAALGQMKIGQNATVREAPATRTNNELAERR